MEPFCLEESDLPEGELRKTEIRQGPERRSHDVEARKGSRKGSTLLETALDGWSDRSDWLPFVFQAGSMVLAAMVIGEGHRWDTKNSPWDDTGMPLCTTDRKTGEASLLSWRVGEGVNASDVEKELELVWTFVDHIGPLELPIFAQAVPGYMDVAVVLLLDLPKCRKPVLEISKGWSCD